MNSSKSTASKSALIACTLALLMIAGGCLYGMAQPTTVRLDISNQDSSKIGFLRKQSSPSIGPRGILLKQGNVILPDTYHNNIKVVDLKRENVRVVGLPKDSSSRSWLRDITTFQDQVLISTDTNVLYRLDPKTWAVDRVRLSPIEGFENYAPRYFASRGGDSLKMFISSTREMRVLGPELEVGRTYQTDDYDEHGNVRGLVYHVDRREGNDHIQIGGTKVALGQEYSSVLDYYNGTNVDATEEGVVYFEVAPEQKKFAIHHYPK